MKFLREIVEWYDNISLHWSASWWHITSVESAMMTNYFTGVLRWNITSVKKVMMTYCFTGECDITSLKGVKMEYHFSEKLHDDVLLHWKISRWHITKLESVKVAYHANEECHDDTQVHWKVSWCMKFNRRMSRWSTSSPKSHRGHGYLWSARRRDLYLTTHDTHNRQISMLPVGFEPKISAGERPAVCGRSPAEIMGSNPTGAMDICLLWVSCVVR